MIHCACTKRQFIAFVRRDRGELDFFCSKFIGNGERTKTTRQRTRKGEGEGGKARILPSKEFLPARGEPRVDRFGTERVKNGEEEKSTCFLSDLSD